MPYKDKAKQAEIEYKWVKEKCRVFTLKIRNDTGVPSALDAACQANHETAPNYIRRAIVAQLKKDGYMSYEASDYDPDRVAWPKPD